MVTDHSKHQIEVYTGLYISVKSRHAERPTFVIRQSIFLNIVVSSQGQFIFEKFEVSYNGTVNSKIGMNIRERYRYRKGFCTIIYAITCRVTYGIIIGSLVTV